MKNKLSLVILLHLLATTVLLHGAEDSTQLKETVLSALDFLKTGNYSGELSVEQSDGKSPYKVKMFHVSSKEYGELVKCEYQGFKLIARNGNCNVIMKDKVYAITLQDPHYHQLHAFQQVFAVFQFLLENIPCEYHEATTKCDGKPGHRVIVDFPKEYTQEQLDTLRRVDSHFRPDAFWSKLIFNIGKQNGFLYSYEIYYPDGRRGNGMSFSKVTINPEWSLEDFTPPAELETVEISTEKQFEKAFPSAQNRTSPQSRQPQGRFQNWWFRVKYDPMRFLISCLYWVAIVVAVASLAACIVLKIRQRRQR